jgi:hypothetical protein
MLFPNKDVSRFKMLHSYPIWHTTEKGFTQYGYLKNYTTALFHLLIKGKQIRTFSKAHIAEN